MSDGRLDGTLFKAASTGPRTHKKTIVRREQCYAKNKNIIFLVVFFGEILWNCPTEQGKQSVQHPCRFSRCRVGCLQL